MTHVLLPAIWLLVLIVGLSQLAETVYTPSLPDIANALQTSESMVEYTLTIYLFAFAIGTLFWGKLSDKLGRKPCMISGLIIFIIGCIGCYFSHTIELLMISRFIQAFGGSTCSVVGQAICRDAFHGSHLGRVYSSIGSSLALFPAVGPVIGALIAQHFGWNAIFLFLIMFSMLLTLLVLFLLPETHHTENRTKVSILDVLSKLLRDPKVIGFAIIVGGANGISFSYFAEGPFYLIKNLGISLSQYGFTFTAIAFSSMMGGILSKKLHQHHGSQVIMKYGLMIMLVSTIAFSSIAFVHINLAPLPIYMMIGATVISQMMTMFGHCMATSNALALALQEYKWCIGTASSLFGFFYYCLISVFTLGMGALHDGTLMPMPLYFMAIAILMLIVQRRITR